MLSIFVKILDVMKQGKSKAECKLLPFTGSGSIELSNFEFEKTKIVNNCSILIKATAISQYFLQNVV